jgi:hypothetical protein
MRFWIMSQTFEIFSIVLIYYNCALGKSGFHGLMVMTPDSESGSPSSILGETFFINLSTEQNNRNDRFTVWESHPERYCHESCF